MTREQFGAAVRARLDDLGRSQEWLGLETSRIEDRDPPYIQATVSQWLLGKTEPAPKTVFAIEQALGVNPGTLSRLLGYLPPSTRSATTVRDAIAADPKLTATGRRVIAAVYEELVDGSSDGS